MGLAIMDGVTMENCPDGELVTGGGFVTTAGTPQYSFPVDKDSWEVALDNDDSVGAFFTGYAVCMGPRQ